ncbi:1-(5-phosphoribosyl)-5-[(5-phosphoribosylamino)methylideneamino] imidazole-4-carboxamide isomerase [Lysobacter sp. CFH 32150]|uniref:1-(5-phosphoribosyl)-5-[(5- phosphoribosylamino)methylideneamino]imidazole-4- carboxamide isomerase n=1 Tax=Lysobacter sp. CFH 32150 TaxID=2927128 RepID=UPI001FA7ABD8|nr:1-(5-phosphoribosyl)-5-[(5-phosphoribosylamino)methylideneamino] imidazole-4-carboxamide isomerase [Lysobacter sp. CFH 32150]MCI4567318.1 1-(5-phosphoribosyl)-5-[(5-phosphoribosylamino)methylideneamino] imidazole-4-carboxamide isomerase [Lysobacter sp. CFH 32150]
MSFTIYPAIDVRCGRVVRLHQGDYARETRYPEDPYALAMRYADAGANWLHLVDLDAAREGGYKLQPLLQRIVEDGRLRVQTGGGIRSASDVEALLELGAHRVVVGSLAVELRERVASWLARYGCDRVTVALDARCGTDGRWWPATRGWTGTGQATLGELVRFYSRSGLRHLLCTDIARDGTLAGPNLALYALLREWAPKIELQASGGARNVVDVEAARDAGCAGIVLGKSLLDGELTLAEALAC